MGEGSDTSGGEGAQLRSALNRLASIGAGQEQLQKDVEKLKLYGQQAIVLGIYTVALAGLIYLTLRSVKAAIK
jgi:hypothetical protein